MQGRSVACRESKRSLPPAAGEESSLSLETDVHRTGSGVKELLLVQVWPLARARARSGIFVCVCVPSCSCELDVARAPLCALLSVCLIVERASVPPSAYSSRAYITGWRAGLQWTQGPPCRLPLPAIDPHFWSAGLGIASAT